MSDEPTVRVLAITASPDDRPSTRNLELIVEEIDRRPGHSASLWFLRHQFGAEPPTGTRVVDDLRTWGPSGTLERLGGGAIAPRLRGLRLRAWLREANPDIVILDDGLGVRVLDPLRHLPPIIVRTNRDLPLDIGDEQFFGGVPARRIIGPGVEVSADSTTVSVEHPLADGAAERNADSEFRHQHRLALDLPVEAQLITGWGDDGWLDGPDLFLRTLWSLHQRHRTAAHAVWFGLSADRDETERLVREAGRMGLGDHFHVRPDTGTADRLCGDAVFLSYRDVAVPGDITAAILSGAPVVAFRACGIFEPADQAVDVVDDIDVEAAASALAAGLGDDRAERWQRDDAAAIRRTLSVGRIADDILASAPNQP